MQRHTYTHIRTYFLVRAHVLIVRNVVIIIPFLTQLTVTSSIVFPWFRKEYSHVRKREYPHGTLRMPGRNQNTGLSFESAFRQTV